MLYDCRNLLLILSVARVPIIYAYIDNGYRGHNYLGDVVVHIADNSKKKLSRGQKKRRKRRTAVEPKIGRFKSDHRLDRCYLKGLAGDAINVILAAAGSNFCKLLHAIVFTLIEWLT